MSKSYQIPFYRFCKIITSNGGLSRNGFLHLAPWIIKTTLIEPLRWMESIKYANRINHYNLEQSPLFILGYYRSGTTFLQRMFMQDDTYGYTSIFQSVLPEIMLTCEKRMTPLLDNISEVFNLKNHFHRIPLKWSGFPGEEDVALTSMLHINTCQWGTLFPKNAGDYLTKYVLMKELSPSLIEEWKMNYLFLLKKISIANNNKPLVLKNPPNTARIKLLLSLFPDAKFIHIIRNPNDVFASNQRFWDVIFKNYALGTTQSVSTDQLIMESYAGIMQQYLDQRYLIPKARLSEVLYEDFIKDPVSTMSELYKVLNLGDFERCKPAMTSFAETQKQYTLLHHQLDHKTMDKISENWAPYIHFWSQQYLAGQY